MESVGPLRLAGNVRELRTGGRTRRCFVRLIGLRPGTCSRRAQPVRHHAAGVRGCGARKFSRAPQRRGSGKAAHYPRVERSKRANRTLAATKARHEPAHAPRKLHLYRLEEL